MPLTPDTLPTAEVAPPPIYETPEARTEQPPHFSIPGFEKLPPDRQRIFLAIPLDKLSIARPAIEKEIAGLETIREERTEGHGDVGGGKIEVAEGSNRVVMADSAIETYHRAAAGDPKAAEELMDHKREILKKEPTEEEIYELVFAKTTGNIFEGHEDATEWLDLIEQLRSQFVFDLFKEFRGELASPDEAIKPADQLKLFEALSETETSFDRKIWAARQTLDFMTEGGQRDIGEAINTWGVIKDGYVLESGIAAVRKGLKQQQALDGSAPLILDEPRTALSEAGETAPAEQLATLEHADPDELHRVGHALKSLTWRQWQDTFNGLTAEQKADLPADLAPIFGSGKSIAETPFDRSHFADGNLSDQERVIAALSRAPHAGPARNLLKAIDKLAEIADTPTA